MIALLRIFCGLIFAIGMFIFGCGYCLLKPRDPQNLFHVARLFCKMAPIFGYKLELRIPENAYKRGAHIYIGNHQSNWDLFTISSAVTPGVVTVGKKSLAWVPLFGALYWLSGNILIDRDNKSKAKGTIGQVAEKIKERQVSVWMFPEGTRSRGRGLLPFKTGAFHAALAAEVPIIPIVCSSTDGIKLNRWNNGHVIVEMLDPVSIEGYEKSQVRELSQACHSLMSKKLDELNQEVESLNQETVTNKK